MKLTPFLLAALTLAAQVPLSIDSGSASDPYAIGGAKYGAAQQPDMAKFPGVFKDLRYGVSFEYSIPAPIGTCTVTLSFLENRPAIATPTVPAAGAGLRIFTVSANGVTSAPIDLFLRAGPQTPYMMTLPPVPILDGRLRLQFVASRGNASVSGIQADCTPTPVSPLVRDPDGAWRLPGDLRVTGFIEQIGGPLKETLRLNDGTMKDGFSGQVRIGTCSLTYQAGRLVVAVGC